MRETTRTFIAIPIPEPIEKKLVRRQSELTPKVPGCRWTAGLPFHITLAFLGDVRNGDLNELCLAVASAVEPFEPFELQVEGLGAFPSPQKPRVIWAGVTAPNLNPLLDLREAVVAAATRVGYRPDDPRFHPHVSLGRIKTERGAELDLTKVVERGREWSMGSVPVAEIVTYASTLDAGGPSYAALGRGRLRGRKTGPSH
ncbi:MAG: RNA 2',3'-cyclic phosphodiesterase [Isosphaeraceae bacterium]